MLAGCASTHGSAPIRERFPAAANKPPAARIVSSVAFGRYRVLPGDTLYKIAFEHGQDPMALASWNRLADPDRIRGGDILLVVPPQPDVATHALPATAMVETKALAPPVIAKPGNTAASGVPPALDNFATSDDAPPDAWSWPVRGSLLSRFGEDLNKGIDIAAARGAPVRAAAPGRVVYAGSGLRGYGKLIIIRHGTTLLSAYAHNARILVTEGQHVRRGQTVGEIGDSDADRVKLHFEIREFGKPVDPLNYLPNAG